MRVIIAGSRTIDSLDAVVAAVEASGFELTEVVSGGAPGPDRLGENFADGAGIPKRVFKAQWRRADGRYDPGAGSKRNAAMKRYAEALVAIYDGSSSGTQDMIDQMRLAGKPVFVLEVEISRNEFGNKEYKWDSSRKFG